MSSTSAAGSRAARTGWRRALVAVAVPSLAAGCDTGHAPLTFDGRPTAAWVAELDDTSRDPLPALEALTGLTLEVGLADLEETDSASADRIRGFRTSDLTTRLAGRPVDADRAALEGVRPRLVALARDPRPEVRRRALCNLALFETVPGAEEEALRTAITSDSTPMRTCALLGASRFSGASPRLADAVAEAARDSTFRVRMAALMALGHVSTEADRHLDVVSAALDDPNIMIRAAAAWAIRDDLRDAARPLAAQLRERLAKAEDEFEATAMRQALDAADPDPTHP